ncbi:P-loop ATPase, Sll1717 family [Albibacillus kandeliae]|uniref:P-loop ATPase, Sll1717 family n=1 Tax=Albibacillus kandeliae TaxID=2174228 RepID=UPI0013003C1D|nr:ATP-binding protein [Albibacillus kandeliae]
MPNLRELDSFGEVAAEDDDVLDYFLKTGAVDQVLSGKILLVLGRKGSGKTALVRHFTEGDNKDHGKPLSLRSYPWTSHQQLVDQGASPSEAYVASWRLLIAIRLASMVCQLGSNTYLDSLKALQTFLKKNFNSIDPESRAILSRGRLDVNGLTVAPQVAGFALGSIIFGDESRKKVLGLELDSLTNSILNDVTTAIAELGISRLYLHFDELDQGLDQVDETKQKMLVGLILAAREISRSKSLRANICPIVYLRTDIWEQIEFSDKNKITQSASVNLQWDEQSLLQLVNTRLQARLGDEASWSNVEDGKKMRGSQSKWSHITSRTLLRPRDVIQFLNEALQVAKIRPDQNLSFCNDDINESREGYSTYLKHELDDEIGPHWKEWTEALQACSRTETITFQKADFMKNYRRTKGPDNPVNAEKALEMLYRFSVIGCEQRSSKGGSKWSFRYNDPNSGWDAFSPRYKVHQGLKEFAKLKEERAAEAK